ncbi:hypothetical protein, partial [Streptococcus pseudoporcinus]|uniref:hypothetical protein n=1 Tax=Streptococcus pseudoporcinus TaxID=361101 RepID=UPI001C5ACF0B
VQVAMWFDLCYSEYAWDSLSKVFLANSILSRLSRPCKKQRFLPLLFCFSQEDFCPRLFFSKVVIL